MLRRPADHGTSPLRPYLRRLGPFLPLVAVLGLLSSLLEGVGVALLVPLLSIFISANDSTLPGPLRKLGLLFSGNDPHTRIILLGAAIFGLILLKGVIQVANDSLLGSLQARIGRDVRARIANSLLKVDYDFFLEEDAARLTRIAGTDSWFVSTVAQSALALIPAVAGVLVLTALLALLSIKLFLIVVVGAALIQSVVQLFEANQRRLSYETTRNYRLLWQRLLMLLQAPRVVRLFGQEAREQARVEIAVERLRHTLQSSNFFNSVVHPSIEALVALLFLAVLVTGYWSGMSIPEITAFLLLLTRAQPHAKTIARARLGLASFEGSLREVDWMTRQGDDAAQRKSGSPLERLDCPIEFKDVSFAYPNGALALDRVTLTIKPGTTTALIGKSGSGKTTLVNLLCRLLEPQSGQILAGAVPISGFGLADWRQRIAVAGQDMELMSGTVAENIAYGRPDAGPEEIAAVARSAGADAFIEALPDGYDTPVGTQGLSLSGGQRQRIGLARALLCNPDLLILDEAVSAVDALSDSEIVTLSNERRYFRSLLVISHRKTTIAGCDFGIVLENGRVIERGSLRSLAFYRSMAGTPEALASGEPA